MPTVVGPPIDITSSSNNGDSECEAEHEGAIPVYDGFESLCKRYEQQLIDHQSLQLAHQTALSTIRRLQSQLTQTINEKQQAIAARESAVGTLSAQLSDATAQMRQLRSEKEQIIANLRAELRQQRKSFAAKENEHRNKEKKLKDESLAPSKALARVNEALEEQRLLCEQLAERAEKAAPLPRGILRSSFAMRFISPFVVVLIDGDAYKFTRDLTRDSVHGGGRAAHRIKTEVLNYIATHDDIPLHSKIVVRVFFNAGSQRGKLGKDGIRGTANGHTFMLQFSETHPLFDFLDCGSGKERADTKIRQNFELFTDNPYCRAMFLAVCYDAGFVRMLEPYQYSKDALTKIVLVKAGQVAPGFLSVPQFQFTEFRSVFHELHSLKISPVGQTLCGADGTQPANVHTQEIPVIDEIVEPQDSPIGNVPYAPWNHPRSYIRSTSTLVGLAYQATLLGAKGRRAMPTPELIALRVSSFQLNTADGNTKASPSADDRQRMKSRISKLENAIRDNRQAANQPGLSAHVRKTLQETAKRLTDEVAGLKRETAQNTGRKRRKARSLSQGI